MADAVVDFYALHKGDLVLVDMWRKDNHSLYPALVMSDPEPRQGPNTFMAFHDRVVLVITGMDMASTGNRSSIKRYISSHRRIERPIG